MLGPYGRYGNRYLRSPRYSPGAKAFTIRLDMSYASFEMYSGVRIRSFGCCYVRGRRSVLRREA